MRRILSGMLFLAIASVGLSSFALAQAPSPTTSPRATPQALNQAEPAPIFVAPREAIAPWDIDPTNANAQRLLTYRKMRDASSRSKAVKGWAEGVQDQTADWLQVQSTSLSNGGGGYKPNHYMKTLSPIDIAANFAGDVGRLVGHPGRFMDCLQFSIKGICYRIKFKKFLGVPYEIEQFNIGLIKQWRWPVAKSEIVEQKGVSRYYAPWNVNAKPLDLYNMTLETNGAAVPLGNPLTIDLRRVVEAGDKIIRAETLGVTDLDATRSGLLNPKTQLIRAGGKAFGPGLAKWNMRYAQSAAVAQGGGAANYDYKFLKDREHASDALNPLDVASGGAGAGDARSLNDGMEFRNSNVDGHANIQVGSDPINPKDPNLPRPYSDFDKHYANYAAKEYGASRFEYRVHPVPEASLLRAFYNNTIAALINTTVVAPLASPLAAMCSIFMVIVLPPFNVDATRQCTQQMIQQISTATNIDFQERPAPPYFSEGPQGILLSRSLALNGVIFPQETNAQLKSPLGCSAMSMTPGHNTDYLSRIDMFSKLLTPSAVNAAVGRVGCLPGGQGRIAPVLAQTPQMYSSSIAELGVARSLRAAFTWGKNYPLSDPNARPFPMFPSLTSRHIPYFNLDLGKDTIQWLHGAHMPPDCLDQVDGFSNLGNTWVKYEQWDNDNHEHERIGPKVHRRFESAENGGPLVETGTLQAAYHWHFFRYCPYPKRLFCGNNCNNYGCPQYGSGDCR